MMALCDIPSRFNSPDLGSLSLIAIVRPLMKKQLWKCDYKIDIEYDLKVGSRDVGRMRARGILGLEDIHLLGAEAWRPILCSSPPQVSNIPIRLEPQVSSSEISPILLTKREKPLSFDLGIVLFPPRLWLPDKWRHQQSA